MFSERKKFTYKPHVPVIKTSQLILSYPGPLHVMRSKTLSEHSIALIRAGNGIKHLDEV